MKPIIGITCCTDRNLKHYIADAYLSAIRFAGGVPVILPAGSERDLPLLWPKIDGILLTGGGDIDPFLFGEEPERHLGEIEPGRDPFEIFLCRQALLDDMPVLAICRGMQILNVAAGGDMYQDIYSQFQHKVLQHTQQAARSHLSHTAAVTPGSLLHRLAGQSVVKVNSFHHQAVRKVAEPFETAARASDGVIEAIESRTHRFMLGVQWHPEALLASEDQLSRKIFQTFIESCKKT
ncbi:gamma-glutamyl-gamma-aminobutyrate hydrolase family protein [Heyndrickxia acidiproducens]|uniref:gamma-glutamyl-gamma-aminobutyrate hydrolase family protein n=1 Tax=Heyndrickxia acidiproducens TaxID=1121084 RepID=UPI00036EDA40|nr:gamma-glutamyl-gamma-aminobutyrate hydrolase family protein [Heyndrickxia acidiproducens]